MANSAYKFINPYNFIPLSDKELNRAEKRDGKLSGLIEFSLLTKTELFIPNTSNDNAFNSTKKGHKTYDFFSYTDLSDNNKAGKDKVYEPIIPGSEIRGMIRSNFEILTNSCLSSLDSDTIMGKRTHEVFKAGLLKKENDEYFLYEAEDCILRLDNNDDISTSGSKLLCNKSYKTKLLSEGQKIYFKKIDRENGKKGKALVTDVKFSLEGSESQDNNDYQEGYVIKGQNGPKMRDKNQEKHCCHVFIVDEKKSNVKCKVNITILDTVLEAYKKNDDTNKAYSEYEKYLKIFKESGNDYFPVYFSKLGIILLSPASLSSLDSDTIMEKRTHEVFKAGLLKKENDEYFLYEAEDCILRLDNKDDISTSGSKLLCNKSYKTELLSEGQKIYFKKIDRENGKKGKALVTDVKFSLEGSESQDNNDYQEGYVIKGQNGTQMEDENKEKHCCHVFIVDEKKSNVKCKVNITILDTVLEAYKKNDDTNKAYREYEKELKKFKESGNDYFPVYFVEGNILLSPASITREVYSRKLSEMIGNHKACDEKDCLCPACALFGTVKIGEDNFAVTSKIRFSDMKREKKDTSPIKDLYSDIKTIAPLSSPKLNNMEFYLKRPADNAVFWTYDYYIDEKGIINKNMKGINGRKFFWHSKVDSDKYKQSKLNVTIRPLKPGVIFQGKVFFDKLTEEELNQLIFSLNAGEVSEQDIRNKKHGYKLGHAKPLGYGSVALKVDNVKIKSFELIELNNAKKTVKRNNEDNKDYLKDLVSTSIFDSEILSNFEKMTNFNEFKLQVEYPRNNDNPEIFKWFVENHKAYCFDSEQNKNVLKKSPNMRSQEFFAYYMEPLNKELVSTKKLETLQSSDFSKKNSKASTRQAGKERKNASKNST